MLPNIAQNIQEKGNATWSDGRKGWCIVGCVHYGKWNTDACINDIITELFSLQ